MKSPRNRLAAVAVEGRIFAIGGMERLEHLEDTAVVEIYDSATNSWTRGTNAPSDGHGHGMAAVGHEIVVAGGFGDMQSTYIYDTRADKWRAGARMPETRLFPGCAAVGGSVYVFGNRDDGDIPLLRYDVGTDTWATVAQTSVKTHRTAAVVLHGQIYVIGGEDNVTYGLLSRVSRYDPAKGEWTHSE
jgi:N-acetylneuraminic acid mutarotase